MEHIVERFGEYSAEHFIAPVGIFIAIMCGLVWLALKANEIEDDGQKLAAWVALVAVALVLVLVDWGPVLKVGQIRCEQLSPSSAEYTEKNCNVLYPNRPLRFNTTPLQ